MPASHPPPHHSHPHQQQQQPQLQPQQVAQPGAVDYRNTNKRAGHEAVMRAYGVPKGMAGGAGTEVQAKILAQQVQGAPSGLNSYGGHPVSALSLFPLPSPSICVHVVLTHATSLLASPPEPTLCSRQEVRLDDWK